MNAYVRACKYIIILPQFPRLRTEKALKRGRSAAPESEDSKGSEGSEGKVDGASPRGLWPPDGGGLCSLRSRGDSACGAEGGGGGFAADLREGARLTPQVVSKGCVRFRSGGDGPSGRGLRIALRAMLMKSALRIYLSASYVMKSITVISYLRWLFPPFGALRHHLPPAERWDNKAPQSNPFISRTTISTGYSAPVEVLHRTSKWGEVRRLACPLRRFPFAAPPNCGGSPAKRARGNAFPTPAGRLYGFRRQRRHKNGARKGAVPRQRSDTIYLPRAEHSTRL